MLLLLVPFWWQTDWRARYDSWESGADRPIQLAAFLLAAAAQLTGGPDIIRRGIQHFFLRPAGYCWFLFFVNALVLSLFSINPAMSAQYACFTAAAFLAAAVGWEANGQAMSRLLRWTGWWIGAFLGVLWLRLGWNDVTIGGLQHNQVAATAATALVCFQFESRRKRWAGTGLVLLLVVLTKSRSSLLFSGVFLVLMAALRAGRARAAAGILAVAAGVLLFVAADTLVFQNNWAWMLLDGLLSLSDPERGLGSGFTGRTNYWSDGWAAFCSRPLVGYGFRTRTRIVEAAVSLEEINAHNGYLNMLLDVGVVGTMPLIGGLVVSLWGFSRRLASLSRCCSRLDAGQLKVNRDVCRISISLVVSNMVVWAFEPYYLNLGVSHSVLLIIMLAAPVHHLCPPGGFGFSVSRDGSPPESCRGNAAERESCVKI
jgi:O-antigen ligase